jgi:hypothetical protein
VGRRERDSEGVIEMEAVREEEIVIEGRRVR